MSMSGIDGGDSAIETKRPHSELNHIARKMNNSGLSLNSVDGQSETIVIRLL